MSLTIRIPDTTACLTGGAARSMLKRHRGGCAQGPRRRPPRPGRPTGSTSPGGCDLRERLPGRRGCAVSWTVWPRQFRQARLFPSFRPVAGG